MTSVFSLAKTKPEIKTANSRDSVVSFSGISNKSAIFSDNEEETSL